MAKENKTGFVGPTTYIGNKQQNKAVSYKPNTANTAKSGGNKAKAKMAETVTQGSGQKPNSKAKTASGTKGKSNNVSVGVRTDITDKIRPTLEVNVNPSPLSYGPWDGKFTNSGFDSPSDETWYANPVLYQYVPEENNFNYNRTITNIISTEYSLLADAAGAIPTDEGELFSAYLGQKDIMTTFYRKVITEININTNGGTAASRAITPDVFFKYIYRVFRLNSFLQELVQRQSWNAKDLGVDRLLYSAANSLNNPDAIELRNRMVTVLRTLALPKSMLQYSNWLYQYFRTSDHEDSIVAFFSSPEMYNYTKTGDISAFREAVEEMINYFTEDQTFLDQVPRIVGLLTTKCKSLDMVMLDYNNADIYGTYGPCSKAVYDTHWLDIFLNQNIIVKSSGSANPKMLPPKIDGNTQSYIPAAFINDNESIKIHTTETLMHKFGHFGFLWTPTDTHFGDINEGYNRYQFCHKYENNELVIVDVLRENPVTTPEDSYIVKLGDWGTNAWYGSAKGNSVNRFELSVGSVYMAQQKLINDMLNLGLF